MISESESEEDDIPEEADGQSLNHSIASRTSSFVSRTWSFGSNASHSSIEKHFDTDLNKSSQLNMRMNKILSESNSPRLQRKESLSQKEAEKLQLFVFLARCIAQPYQHQRQSEDWTEVESKKLTLKELTTMQKNLKNYLKSGSDSVFGENFYNSMKYFYDHCLQSVHIEKKVTEGELTRSDLQKIYLQRARIDIAIDMEIDFENADDYLQKGAATAEQLWTKTFELTIGKATESDSRVVELYKPELQYDYFRKVLSLQKHHFQLVFNSAKLDDQDEQVAALKRDLNKQKEYIESREALDEFDDIRNGMQYLASRKQSIMLHLQQHQQEDEALTIAGSGLKKMIGLMKSNQISSIDEGSSAINKEFFEYQSYNISVVIHNATGLKFLGDKKVFVLMELNGSEKKYQTEHKSNSNANFDINCGWTVNFPCTSLRLAVAIDHSLPFHISDEKEIAKLSIPLHCTYNIHKKYFQMNPIKGAWLNTEHEPTGDIKICISVRYSANPVVKTAGLLHCYGKKHMTSLKKRFVVLTRISDFTNALCIFKEAEYLPSYYFQLNDYTVDKAEKFDGKGSNEKFEHTFKLIRLGDELHFAAKNKNDQVHWVSKLYLATGQSFKPSLLEHKRMADSIHFDHTNDVLQEELAQKSATKHGFDHMINADAFEFDQKKFYYILLQAMFEYKLKQDYTFLGKLMIGEKLLLEDYASRYNIRYCYTQLCYLKLLISHASNGHTMDTRLMYTIYGHILKCSLNAGSCDGNMRAEDKRSGDETSTMTKSEAEFFEELKGITVNYLENAISHFRKTYPCGFPPKNFLSNVKLFERIHSECSTECASGDEYMTSVFENILKKAALNNYITLSSLYKIKELSNDLLSFDDSLPVYLSFTQQCISDTDELRCYYAEVISYRKSMFIKYHQYYWLLFSTELFSYLDQRPRYSFVCLKLFQVINEFCITHESLQLSDFHNKVIKCFEPIVSSYMEYKKDLILASADINLSNETYEPFADQYNGELTSTIVAFLEEYKSTKYFIEMMKWPQEEFNNKLKSQLIDMRRDAMKKIFHRYFEEFELELRHRSMTFEFIIPKKCCVIMNALTYVQKNFDVTNVSMLIVEDLIEKQEKTLADKYAIAILTVLKKLAFYDHGSYTSKFANIWKPKSDLASEYFTFLANNVRECRHEIKNNDRRHCVLKSIWGETCLRINVWLTERKELSLHPYQLHVLADIAETCRNLLAVDITKEEAENENFKEIKLRIDCEEAFNSLKE